VLLLLLPPPPLPPRCQVGTHLADGRRPAREHGCLPVCATPCGRPATTLERENMCVSKRNEMERTCHMQPLSPPPAAAQLQCKKWQGKTTQKLVVFLEP
jgi:hypothetical protein